MTKKLLTVFGATGAQGGNLIVYILGHPRLSAELQLRGVTRDVTKPAAVALTNKGVEVVQADMDDLDSLKEAVNGSWAVFGMTNRMPLHFPTSHVLSNTVSDTTLSQTGIMHLAYGKLRRARALRMPLWPQDPSY